MEEIFFKGSIDIIPKAQISESAFALLKVPTNNTIPQIVNGTTAILNERVYISMNTTLEQIYNTVLFLIKKGETQIVLQDIPLDVETYNRYEINVLSILDKLNSIPFNNIHLDCNIYLNDVIKNINKYSNKCKSIYVNIYGMCSDIATTINPLLNYMINTKILQTQTSNLATSKLGLSIQANTACSPLTGISNTYGSVLWLLDLMFQISSANVATICVDERDFNVVYAYMAYNLASLESKMYDISATSSLQNPNISVYHTRNNYYNFIIIHKDINNDSIQVNINLNSTNIGRVYRLITNKTIEDEDGISFGELSLYSGIPIQTRTKYQTNKLSGEEVKPINNRYTFIIDKLSAVVLQIPISSMTGGAYFENINNDNERSTIVSIQPNTEIGDVDAVSTTMTIKDFKRYVQPNL